MHYSVLSLLSMNFNPYHEIFARCLLELLSQWGGHGGLRMANECVSLTIYLCIPEAQINALQNACFTL